MSFIDEIKRRKVFRVAIAYLIVGWLIVQIVDVVKEPLSLPDWFHAVTIVFLAIAFPISLMLSWAYDVTPDGVVREDTGERAPASMQIDYGKIALVAVLILGAFLAGNYVTNSSGPDDRQRSDVGPIERYRIDRDSTLDLDPAVRWSSDLTPDGGVIIIWSRVDGVGWLLSRSLGELEFRAIGGTENARVTFAISPGGQSIVFQDAVDGLLNRIAITGGAPVPLGDPHGNVLGNIAWGANGDIVFTTLGRSGLARISENGGKIEALTNPDAQQAHNNPHFIAGTDTLILTIGEHGFSANPADRLAFLTADGELRETGVEGAAGKTSAGDWLVYFNRNTLFAARLDPVTLEIGRERYALADDVAYRVTGNFQVASDGRSLIYAIDGSLMERDVVWVDRQGGEESALSRPGRYEYARISPLGDTIVVLEESDYGPDLWVHSLARGTRARLTNEPTEEVTGPSSPDGRFVYYSGGRPGDIYRVDVRRRGDPEQLTDSASSGEFPGSIPDDGSRLFFNEFDGPKSTTRWLDLRQSTFRELHTIRESMHAEYLTTVSPDGRWLAFTSEESGEAEVYVTPFPNPDEKNWQVSVGGGSEPHWGGDGREIFYRSEDHLMSVAVEFAPDLRPGQPRELFSLRGYILHGTGGESYDYDRLSDRFLFVKSPTDGGTPANRMILVKNWQALLPGSGDEDR